MTLSIANHDASLPVAYRLYLPKEWASDRKRRRKVGVPDEISFTAMPNLVGCESSRSLGLSIRETGQASAGMSSVAGQARRRSDADA